MADCKVTVDAGVCKMRTVIIAKTNEDGEVVLDIQSDCSKVLEMSWGVKPVYAWSCVESPMNETEIYQLASKCLKHAACPVPCAVLKAIEVAGELGIKRDAVITIE